MGRNRKEGIGRNKKDWEEVKRMIRKRKKRI